MSAQKPAFPVQGIGFLDAGMSLRDYFAAKAMQAMFEEYTVHAKHTLAQDAYRVADAMLEEREK